jgi:hypothetical protein
MSTNISEVRALLLEAARTSEMLVDTELRTRQYFQEDSELQREIMLFNL